MDIRELRTFIAIAQAGNITRAAEELHISQPALSRQIIKMENELGCKLLERGGHGISLTNAGHLLLNRARELSDLLDKTEAELKAPDVASGEVSIACSETRATLAIAHVAKRLELTHPGIRFKFRSESSDDVTEHLSRGIVDFGIAVGPARTDDYHAIRLPDTDRWGALVPADDDLAAAASLGPQDLIDRPLIMPEKILAQQRICDWMGCDLTRLDVRATYNLLYTASAQAHRATLSYATRLASRIESCPGYTHGMPVYLIGSFPTDRVHNSVEGFAQVDHYSVPLDTVAPLNKHIYYYLRDWLNLPIEEPAEADLMAMAERPEFAAMPRYPDDGSVQIIDGCLVVKVQEEYTPKSDFEIAYENRR